MDIPLNLPPGDRQQEFIDQFNSALRRISSNSTGSAGFLPDGSFEASMTGGFRIDPDTQATLTWTLVKTPDGTLPTIKVEPSQPEPPTGWDRAAEKLVTAALSATVAAARMPFFRRVSFAYMGPALDGEYWLPQFRLGPALPDDADPQIALAERWVDIDMTVDAIDDLHATALAQERARRLAARLSLLLHIGFQSSLSEHKWVLVQGSDGTWISERRQLGFVRTTPMPTAMPAKGDLCRLGEFRGDLTRFPPFGDRVYLPNDSRRILRGANTKPHPIGDAFDRCARLYQVGLVAGRRFPSVSLAYTIAAAEAIAQADSSYRGFSDFIRKHWGRSDRDVASFLEYLYGKVRSAHFHQGEFPLGEFAPIRFDPLMDAKWVETSSLHLAGFSAVRAAIVDWCVSKVASES